MEGPNSWLWILTHRLFPTIVYITTIQTGLMCFFLFAHSNPKNNCVCCALCGALPHNPACRCCYKYILLYAFIISSKRLEYRFMVSPRDMNNESSWSWIHDVVPSLDPTLAPFQPFCLSTLVPAHHSSGNFEPCSSFSSSFLSLLFGLF